MEDMDKSPDKSFELLPPLPPPPPHFLPGQLQFSEVKPRIHEATATLDLLQKQVRWLHEAVKKAEQRVKEYESYRRLLNRHALSFGPSSIQDLPAEILAVIFEFCCTDISFMDQTRTPYFAFDRVPWILSWVCSSWRQVAHNTSSLWSTIPGPLKPFTGCISTEDVEIITSTIIRCCSSIKVAIHIDDVQFPGRYLSILTDIAPHLRDIQELTLRCDKFEGLKRLYVLPELPIPDDGLACLHSLSFKVITSHHGTVAEPFTMQNSRLPPLFQKMPKLKHMSITSPSLLRTSVPFYNLEFPWKQLSSLDLHHTGLTIILGILRSAIRLHQLKARDIAPNWSQSPLPTGNPFIHPTLQLLHLQSRIFETDYNNPIPFDCPATFLYHISLPKLKNLSIKDSFCISSATVKSLLERSRCSLSVLCFLPAIDSIPTVLQSCPDVKQLVIGALFGDEELKLLQQPYEGQWLVPELEALVLLSPLISDPKLLENVIQTRNTVDGVRGIKRVELVIRKQDVKLLWDDGDDSSSVSSDAGGPRVSFGHEEIIRFSERCHNHISSMLRLTCGYELVHDSMNMERLKHLCNEIEAFPYDPAVHDQVSEWKTLLPPLLKIHKYLSDVEEFDPLGTLALGYTQRLRRVLRIWTHDPWIFEDPPAGWVRADATKSEVPDLDIKDDILIYTAEP
ncbi:hypothetical protein CVT24_010445 [Panaeolus cyanescens]|uniref:F-box domain-containing protein n=1 Tax=Panaeolus cyanescens TaxID=181874 RepID=A0A409YPS1_9AGAR|nr:hypothetical protein CVT24_010445 [Panaeolus cyanescens]